MRSWSLFFHRVTLAAVLVVWGVEKLSPPSHGAWRVAGGMLEIVLGLGLAVGVYSKSLYPGVCAITGLTHVEVWGSVIALAAAECGWIEHVAVPVLHHLHRRPVLAAIRDEDQFPDTPTEQEDH